MNYRQLPNNGRLFNLKQQQPCKQSNLKHLEIAGLTKDTPINLKLLPNYHNNYFQERINTSMLMNSIKNTQLHVSTVCCASRVNKSESAEETLCN